MLSTAALIGLAFVQTACAQKPPAADTSKYVYIVTHIDVTPNFSEAANKAIQKYAAIAARRRSRQRRGHRPGRACESLHDH